MVLSCILNTAVYNCWGPGVTKSRNHIKVVDDIPRLKCAQANHIIIKCTNLQFEKHVRQTTSLLFQKE